MTTAAELRRNLAHDLASAGHLRTQPWRHAVEAVPRHEFLAGGFFEQVPDSAPTAWRPVMPGTDDWLRRCYADESLVTQIAGTIAPGDLRGEIMRAPTSSSTMPNLVVRMHEELRVEDGHQVLEVGTGTGYSTALLCRRLGDDAVTSVEVDESVSLRARNALAACGAHPDLVVGDGLLGYAENAPYDRITVTCAVVTVPYEWVGQTRAGGTILATVGGWLHSSELARLTVEADGTARGTFLGGQISFMLARPQLPPPLGLLPDFGAGDERRTAFGIDLLADWTARFVAQIAAPRAQRITLGPDGRENHVLLDVETGSWAALTRNNGQWTVRQGGPARLWDDVADHITRWRTDGSPPLERFRITVTPQGQEITWPRVA
ncbi:ATP-grasp peptide maturase system methyltransferase [Kitasatospora sp. NPDC089797]|uniref:ATP-grasp peptide maturase system methyltransferase n=1 Tax=Kitasatospora sp. NPDC089797 TaxID=3155298 RepID=UPI00344899DC